MKSLLFTFITLAIASTSHGSFGHDDYQVDYKLSTSRALNFTDAQGTERDPEIIAINNEIISIIRNMNNIDVADLNSQSIATVNDQLEFARKCNSFASASEMGQWGKIIAKEMRTSRPAAIYKGTSDLKAVCPRYDSLNETGKEAVWVMILNAMAHLESSCDRAITAKGPNGSLIGLLQLHNGAEEKYAKNCRRGDGKTAEGSFRCGLSMLNAQLTKRNALFARQSYWDVLRPQAKSQKYKKVQKALRSLSICK